jgi:hypothetical protein
MKNKTHKPGLKLKEYKDAKKEDLFDVCLRKGLIEKTEYGYYFKPEFFETLKIYEEE